MDILHTILGLFTAYGYVIVFFGVMLENAGLPVPGETILLAAGFFASQHHFSVPAVIITAMTGATIGDNLGYLAGRRLGRGFAERYGRYVFLTAERLRAGEEFFERHGDRTILIARFVSGLRVFAAFFAGMSHMRWRIFFIFNAAGAVLWAMGITLVGYFFGQSWELIERILGRAGLFLLGIIVLWGALEALRRFQQQAATEGAENILARLPVLERREAALVLFNLMLIASFVWLSRIVARDHDQQFDEMILRWVHSQARPWLDWLMLVITQFGSSGFLLVAGLAVAVFFFRRYGRRREAVAMLLAVGLAQLLNQLCKYSFQRPRPHLWDTRLVLHSYSFPSGHVMVSMAVYGSAALLLSYAFPRGRWLFRSAATVLVLLIGLSRVYLGVHWPSDVLAGFAAGLVIMFVIVWWHSRDLSPFAAHHAHAAVAAQAAGNRP